VFIKPVSSKVAGLVVVVVVVPPFVAPVVAPGPSSSSLDDPPHPARASPTTVQIAQRNLTCVNIRSWILFSLFEQFPSVDRNT